MASLNSFTGLLLSFFSLLFLSSASFAKGLKPFPPIIDEQAIDRTTSPCQNFYKFACGSWLQNAKIPSDQSSLYRFDDGTEENYEAILLSILKKASEQAPSGSDLKKASDLNFACGHTDEKQEMALVFKEVARIQEINRVDRLMSYLASRPTIYNNTFFSIYSAPDLNNASMTAGYLNEDGLGLPEREYYFPTKDDKDQLAILSAYKVHVQKSFQLMGFSQKKSAQAAIWVLQLETELAKSYLTREEQRNPQLTNNPMSIDELEKLAPEMHFRQYLHGIGIGSVRELNVTNPKHLRSLNQILKQSNSRLEWNKIKAYLVWKVISSVAGHVGGKLSEEQFNFYGRTLEGVVEPEPRWKHCLNLVSINFRDALAKEFVKELNGEAARDEARNMVEIINSAFADQLIQNSWLDSATREAALQKLSKLKSKIGYPDRWVSYEKVQVNKGAFLESLSSASSFAEQRSFSQIGKPVDRNDFGMPPWMLNAYYDPAQNEMVFPLAQMLPPAMDLNASLAANWGSLGSLLGHELSHGYDDEGHQYDGDGNLRNWWTESMSQEFSKRSQCFVDQANNYEIRPGLQIDGRVTLGEHLADQAGTKLAYMAMLKARKLRPAPVSLSQYNDDQQFFIAYAQSWCHKQTEESLRLQVKTDPHPPAEFRVNAVVQNLLPFREAFACGTGSRMAPVETCSLW